MTKANPVFGMSLLTIKLSRDPSVIVPTMRLLNSKQKTCAVIAAAV